jgi:hypothetical protein
LSDSILNLTNSMNMAEQHRQEAHKLLTSEGVNFTGPNTVNLPNRPYITTEADLFQEVVNAFVGTGRVTSTHPKEYWRSIVETAIMQYKLKQLRGVLTTISYTGDNDSLSEFVGLVVEGASELDVAAMRQFIWQVKRKLAGKKVLHHLMPILWGPMGSGKSEALKRLLSPIAGYVLHGLSMESIDDYRNYRQFAEHLVCFYDEMPRVDKANIEAIKLVITAETLTGRLLYSNSFKPVPQNCTFFGTSNMSPSQLIRDTTGLRRFYYMKSLAKTKWHEINAFDVTSIWRSVDENADCTWMTQFADQFRQHQEEVRIKDTFELFTKEYGYVVQSEGDIFFAKEAYDAYVKFSEEEGNNKHLAKQTFNKRLVQEAQFRRVRPEDAGVWQSKMRDNPAFYGKLLHKPRNEDNMNLKHLKGVS